MNDPYAKHLPPPDVAVALPPEELALFVLRFLLDPDTSSYRNRYNFTLLSATPYGSLPGPQRKALQLALAEAWAWLEREGLVVPSPGETGDWYQLSRRGRTLEGDADFTAYRRGELVRKESLSPILEQKVWPLFIRGDYDIAVVQAFKLVEIRVRELGGFTNEDYGVDMIRRAFSPKPPKMGPLTDPGQTMAEREAMSALFSGAIGVFKNPGSHRIVTWESAAASEAIYLANALLRMLDGIAMRLKS